MEMGCDRMCGRSSRLDSTFQRLGSSLTRRRACSPYSIGTKGTFCQHALGITGSYCGWYCTTRTSRSRLTTRLEIYGATQRPALGSGCPTRMVGRWSLAYQMRKPSKVTGGGEGEKKKDFA